MASGKRIVHCTDCDRGRVHEAKGLCKPCYERRRIRPVSIGICANCAYEKRISYRGLCGACYEYDLRYGKPRPLRLIHRDARAKARETDNKPGGDRVCLTAGCTNDAQEEAPWGLGFCEDCMPQIQRTLASHRGLVRKSAA